MAEKKKVLLVAQAMKPYLEGSESEDLVYRYAVHLQDQGLEVRILMPRFGAINERRHRLHEVVRLSGMNITVDDDDYPLIIKVASLPGTRMQVYFLDNDEFFKRKQIFTDDKGQAFEDNIDRMLFFNKGVIETVKKFGWSPDVIHIHGWMGALLPAYLRLVYKHEPIFQNARVVYSAMPKDAIFSAFETGFEEKMQANFLAEAMADFFDQDGSLDFELGAARHADGLILHPGHGLNAALLDTACVEARTDFEGHVPFYRQLCLPVEKL